MPAKSVKQQQMLAIDLQRKRAGKRTKTKMSEEQLEEFAETKHTNLPTKVKAKKK